MSYTLSNNIIIRRENFGALIFNPNTELTIKIDVTGFKFLKNLINYNKFSLQERSEYEMNEFFLEMIRFGVIIKKRKEPNTFFQFIERTNYDINVLSFPESYKKAQEQEYKKAQEQDTKIITEEEFLKMIE